MAYSTSSTAAVATLGPVPAHSAPVEPEDDLYIFLKTLSVAQHLMAHPELLDQGKEPMHIAIDYIYNLDVVV